MKTNDPMLSVSDVAERCNVSIDTVRKWRQTGVGPRWHRLGKHLRCTPGDFDAWLRRTAEPDPVATTTTGSDDDNGGWD